MNYEDLKHGDSIEYEDFWHSNILSWKKGIVIVAEGRKHFQSPDHKWILPTILPHRMNHLRNHIPLKP